jgi:hypothetical protein
VRIIHVICAGWVFGIGAYACEMSVSAGMEIMLAAVIMAIVD